MSNVINIRHDKEIVTDTLKNLSKPGTQMDWHEALAHYGINYNVSAVPAYAIDNHGRSVDIGKSAMVREDTGNVIPGVTVGSRYNVIQTSSYADIGNRITQELGAEFVSGGTFKDGKIAFLQAKLPGHIRIGDTNDIMEQNLTFINSFDGSTSFMVLPSTMRLWCSNMLNAMGRQAKNSGLKIRHTRSADERIQEADKILIAAEQAFEVFGEKANRLAQTTVTEKQMEQAARMLLKIDLDIKDTEMGTRVRNNYGRLRYLSEHGQGIEPFRGTAWGLLNSMTEFADTRELRANTNQFEAKLIGSGALIKDRAVRIVDEIIAA